MTVCQNRPPLTSLAPITSERTLVRPLTPDDAAAFRDMTDEPAIIDAVHFLQRPFTHHDAVRLITGDGDGGDCFLGVWLNETGALIGTVGVHRKEGAVIEIGYWFASAFHGRGLAREAVAAVIDRLAVAHPDCRLMAECREENTSSWRLLERCGFQADGGCGARPGRKRLVRSEQ